MRIAFSPQITAKFHIIGEFASLCQKSRLLSNPIYASDPIRPVLAQVPALLAAAIWALSSAAEEWCNLWKFPKVRPQMKHGSTSSPFAPLDSMHSHMFDTTICVWPTTTGPRSPYEIVTTWNTRSCLGSSLFCF